MATTASKKRSRTPEATFIGLNGSSEPKRAKLLDDSDSESSSNRSGGLAFPANGDFKINEEYAKRFEHNEKRKERERLEEKYGKSKTRPTREEDNEGGSDESTSESEDDEGELATEGLDAEILATLQAIRSKDPKVYDKNVKFYTEFDENGATTLGPQKEKPMYLKDYHRKNFMEGKVEADDPGDEAPPPKSYVEEQQALKDAVVREMQAAADEQEDESDNGDAFLVRKSKPEPIKTESVALPNVEDADRDPDTFLSNFIASRAWVPDAASKFQPFESDDEEEDARADAFEEAYNLRFENPEHANEKLMTHSREAAAKYSARREDISGRKKAREKERRIKEEAKRERDDEKARLRKLKIEAMEEKVKQIRKSAGLHGKQVELTEWTGLLEEDWDDEKWEEEMGRRFGQGYYADKDDHPDSDSLGEVQGSKSKGHKPKWDDDIDIKDIVPDFEDQDAKPNFTLSSDDEGKEPLKKSSKSKKDRLRENAEKKRSAKHDRRIVESLVDQHLDIDMALEGLAAAPGTSKPESTPLFRYRETSPISFGLTPLDILNASDSQLNQFAGLKKLTAFRDPERKRRDKKKLGKKARLREWRKDVFADDDDGKDDDDGRHAADSGKRKHVSQHNNAQDSTALNRTETNGVSKKKKKKRSKKEIKDRVIDI